MIKLTYKRRGISKPQEEKVNASSLKEALEKLFIRTIEEDDTGIFFETEYADNTGGYYVVNVKGYPECGIDLIKWEYVG